MTSDTNTEYQAWLDSLKPGEAVAYQAGGVWRISKVQSRSPSGRITIAPGIVFNSNGSLRTSDVYSGVGDLQKLTKSIKDSVMHDRASMHLHNVIWRTLTLDQLQRIVAIVKEQNPS